MKLFILNPDRSIVSVISDGFVHYLLQQTDTKEFFETYFIQLTRNENQFEHGCFKDCIFTFTVEEAEIQMFVRKGQIVLIQKN